MSVVQRVGDAGTNGKWSILVQGGTNQTDTAGTVRHAYGTIANALEAINQDTSSNSFKITFLDDYTATTKDLSALGTSSRAGGKLGGRTTNKPTILFTGAVNYDKSTSYQSWNTLTFPDSSYVYFSGYDPYFTHINIDGRSLYIFGNQNDTSFVDMKFVSGVERLFGGQNSSNTATVNYTLTLDQIITTADAPIKNLYGGSWDSVVGDVTLKITDSEIYGNVYASGRSIGYTQTGNVTANLENVSIYRYYNKFQTDKKTADTDKDMLKAIDETGGAFFGADGKVTGDVSAYFTGNYYAQYGTWYGRNANTVSGQCNLSFNLTNKGLRFVGTYNAKVSAGNSSITVRNTTVANVFGWDYLYVYNSDVASGSNFGRMQYNSSFSHYYENASTIEYKNGKASYTPDQRGYEGIASFNSSHIYSTGQHWEGGWNRQYYKIIQLWDSGNKFELSGCDKDGSNLFRVEKYIYGVTSSYKAVILGTGVGTKAEALRYILLDSNDSSARNSVNYLTPQALTGESIYTAYYDSPYVRIYYTGTDASVTDSIRLLNSSGRVLLTGTRIAPMIEKLKTISTAGSYTICVNVPYTLNDDDLNAFNTSHNYLANKNVIMQGQGSFIAGGQLKQTTGDWAGKGPDTAATSFRFSRLYPQFKSLKWNNFVMRGDFLDNNGERPTEYYFHGNGRDLSFENCEFTGPVTIDAGGASGYNTKTQGSTVSLKNCKNVKNVYANNSSNASLGITTLMIDSCTGYEDAPVNIDVARVGTVSGLTVNVKNCKAKIASYYTNTAKITGGYTLNVTDSEVSFVNPLVTTSNMAFVYLQGDVTLTDTCKGIPSSSGGKSYLRIYGNVKTSSEKAVYLQDFNEITIDGGQLKLGDSANKIEGGLYYSYRRAAVSLKNSGKLMFAYMPSYQY